MEENNQKCCEDCGKDEALEKILLAYKQDKDNLIRNFKWCARALWLYS
jgi:hypothetical protein